MICKQIVWLIRLLVVDFGEDVYGTYMAKEFVEHCLNSGSFPTDIGKLSGSYAERLDGSDLTFIRTELINLDWLLKVKVSASR